MIDTIIYFNLFVGPSMVQQHTYRDIIYVQCIRNCYILSSNDILINQDAHQLFIHWLIIIAYQHHGSYDKSMSSSSLSSAIFSKIGVGISVKCSSPLAFDCAGVATCSITSTFSSLTVFSFFVKSVKCFAMT